jgi:hypothetical protein
MHNPLWYINGFNKIVTITVYSLCATEFFIRYFKKRPVRLDTGDVMRGTFDRYLKYMSLALAFNTTCLFIRYVRMLLRLE